jgi:hypothetical protein
MHFLEQNEIAEWCREHGIAVDDDRLVPVLGPVQVLSRMQYANGRRSGREPTVAAACVAELGEWTECLLVPLQWGIWASGEDWPTYYAARAAHDERRSIDTAPGHLFDWTERDELIRFLTMVMENGWDADVLAAVGNEQSAKRLFVSHEEWVEVRIADRA